MSDLYQDSVQLILEKLKASIGSDLGEGKKLTYYDGDPGPIPVFNLPAICVELLDDDTEKASVAEHDVTERIVVKVLFNKKDDEDAAHATTDLTQRRILNLINARDPQTGRFLPSTIKGTLTSELDGDRRLGKRIRTQYGLRRRTPDLITAEGQVTVEVLSSLYTNGDLV